MNKNGIVHSKCTKQKWSNKCGTKALSLYEFVMMQTNVKTEKIINFVVQYQITEK